MLRSRLTLFCRVPLGVTTNPDNNVMCCVIFSQHVHDRTLRSIVDTQFVWSRLWRRNGTNHVSKWHFLSVFISYLSTSTIIMNSLIDSALEIIYLFYISHTHTSPGAQPAAGRPCQSPLDWPIVQLVGHHLGSSTDSNIPHVPIVDHRGHHRLTGSPIVGDQVSSFFFFLFFFSGH